MSTDHGATPPSCELGRLSLYLDDDVTLLQSGDAAAKGNGDRRSGTKKNKGRQLSAGESPKTKSTFYLTANSSIVVDGDSVFEKGDGQKRKDHDAAKGCSRSPSPAPSPSPKAKRRQKSSTDDLAADLTQTHVATYDFWPRHKDELAVQRGDPLHIFECCTDMWLDGVNLASTKRGVLPARYAADIMSSTPCKGADSASDGTFEYFLRFLGSVEVKDLKGDEVLCYAISKVVNQHSAVNNCASYVCTIQISRHGIKVSPMENEESGVDSKRTSKPKKQRKSSCQQFEHDKTPEDTRIFITQSKVSTHSKPFVYYILTESCLDKYFFDSDTLGNSSICDVFVNSYKRECEATDIPSHVTHIFANTSWSTGRNMLMKLAEKTGKTYKYHTFLDDDVRLLPTQPWQKYCDDNKLKYGSPRCFDKFLKTRKGLRRSLLATNEPSQFRLWEKFLLTYKPAMAVPNNYMAINMPTILRYTTSYDRMCDKSRSMPMVAPTVFLDAMFIAYNSEAAPLVLPYSDTYDRINYWVSAMLQIIRAKELLYKQVVANYDITASNSQHRPYPVNFNFGSAMRDYFTKERPGLEDVIDRAVNSITSLSEWANYFKSSWEDRILCSAPLKFPVHQYYTT